MRELSLHLLDLLENACEAGATEISVEVQEDREQDSLVITVFDNGRGMSAEKARAATDPFYTTRSTRRVGLGLPLLKAAAELTGGSLSLESRPGRTEVTARFGHSNVDRAPLGDVASSLMAVLLKERAPRLLYSHKVNGRCFRFDSRQVNEVLGRVPLTTAAVASWLHSHLDNNIRALRDGMAL